MTNVIENHNRSLEIVLRALVPCVSSSESKVEGNQTNAEPVYKSSFDYEAEYIERGGK